MRATGNIKLIERIRERIERESGAIPFDQYMEMCLYDEQYGYYTNDSRKVGREGDFYTSAYIGEAMGQAVASFVAEAAGHAPADVPIILCEWGGGDGRMAKTVLDTLANEHKELYGRLKFVSSESSPFHRKLQQETLSDHASRVEAILSPSDVESSGLLSQGFSILYANELLDAFPVRRLRKTGGELKEVFVSWDDDMRSFSERLKPLNDAEVTDALHRMSIRLEEGQTAEINLRSAEWIRSIGKKIVSGAVALIDYGDISSELYSSHRMNGTLVCYRKHSAHDNPYVWIGEQDMTAHVDFGLCLAAAEEAGFKASKLRKQMTFLVEYGILERLAAHSGADPFSKEVRNNRAIRQLLLSDGMSELFKVLTLSK